MGVLFSDFSAEEDDDDDDGCPPPPPPPPLLPPSDILGIRFVEVVRGNLLFPTLLIPENFPLPPLPSRLVGLKDDSDIGGRLS